MKKFHIEYTLFGNPNHKEMDWEAYTIREAVNGVILNEVKWSKFLGCPIPREAVRILKVDGVEFDEDENCWSLSAKGKATSKCLNGIS